MSNISGAIGSENFKMKDCPFHLPKKTMRFSL